MKFGVFVYPLFSIHPAVGLFVCSKETTPWGIYDTFKLPLNARRLIVLEFLHSKIYPLNLANAFWPRDKGWIISSLISNATTCQDVSTEMLAYGLNLSPKSRQFKQLIKLFLAFTKSSVIQFRAKENKNCHVGSVSVLSRVLWMEILFCFCIRKISAGSVLNTVKQWRLIGCQVYC